MNCELSNLGNEALLSSIHALVRASNTVDADLIEHLGELDSRQLYRDHGHFSMFSFCTGVLGFSESVAYNRIEVARLARRLPEVLAPLRRGDIHLSGLRMLAPQLTAENYHSVLAR